MEIDAAEIRFRAERRLGEMLAQQKATEGLNTGTRTLGGGTGAGGPIAEPPAHIPSLSSFGIDKKLSARAQKMAAIPVADFEATVADRRGLFVYQIW